MATNGSDKSVRDIYLSSRATTSTQPAKSVRDIYLNSKPQSQSTVRDAYLASTAGNAVGKLNDLLSSVSSDGESIYKAYKSRYKDDMTTGQMTYRKDAHDWYKDVLSKRNTLNSNIQQMEKLISAYDKFLDADQTQKIKAYLKTVKTIYDSVYNAALSESDMHYQFKTKEEYDSAIEQGKKNKQMLSEDPQNIEEEIAALEQKISDLKEKADKDAPFLSINKQIVTDAQMNKYYYALNPEIEKLDNKLSYLKNYLSEVKAAQEYNSLTHADAWSKMENAADMDEELYYAGIVNQKAKEINAELLASTKMDGEDISVLRAMYELSAFEGKDREKREKEISAKMDELGLDFDDWYSLVTGEKNVTWGEFGKWLLNSISSGASSFNKSLYGTLDYLLGKPLQSFGWENNPISSLHNWADESYKRTSFDAKSNQETMGVDWEFATKAVEIGVAALPDLILAIATYGASTSKTALSKSLSTAAGRATAKTAFEKAGLTVQAMAKNPNFWSGFIRSFGMEYEEAAANGANDIAATFSAMISSLINAAIEIGIDGTSGIQGIPEAVKKGDEKAILSWVTSSLEEGSEEVVQGFISDLVAKIMYDGDRQFASLNENIEEFALGSTVGAVLGAGPHISSGVNNAIEKSNQRKLQKNIAKGDKLTGPQISKLVEANEIAFKKENEIDELSSESETPMLDDLSVENEKTDSVTNAVNKAAGIQKLTETQKLFSDGAKSIGITVEYKNLDYTVKGENGESRTVSPNGLYDRSNNKIILNTSASQQHKPFQFTAKHEFTHFLERSDSYSQFFVNAFNSDAMKQYVQKRSSEMGLGDDATAEKLASAIARDRSAYDPNFNGKYDSKMERLAKQEILADFVGDMLFGGETELAENFLRALNEQDRNDFVSVVKRFFEWLKGLFSKRPELSEIEKLEKQFLGVVKKVNQDYSQKSRAAENGAESDYVYSEKENDDGLQFSFYDNKQDALDWIEKIKSGEISAEEAVGMLTQDSENKKSNLDEIMNLTEEDADTTPELPKPKMQGEGNRERKTYKTLQKSSWVSDEIKKMVADDDFIRYYDGVTNKQQMQEALEQLESGGREVTERWFAKDTSKGVTETDIAIGMILLERYKESGDVQSAISVAEKLSQMGTKAGRIVQMYSILSRFDPDMMVAYCQKNLKEALEILKAGKTQKYIDHLESRLKLTEQEKNTIRNAILQAADLPNNSYEKKSLLSQVESIVANKIPPSASQSLRAWKRISLLLNFKTQLRNFGGNIVGGLMQLVADAPASIADRIISVAYDTSRRTTGLSASSLGKAIKVGAKRGFVEAKEDLKRGYQTDKGLINRYDFSGYGGKNFNEQHVGFLASQRDAIGKALNNVDRFLNFVMDVGDRPFFEFWFENSINNQLRLNNTNVITQEMIDIATQEALERVWQDNSVVSKALSKIRDSLNFIKIGTDANKKGNRALANRQGRTSYGLGDMLLFFVKTPANIAKAVYEFSPISAISVARNIAKLQAEKKSGGISAITQRNAARSIGNMFAGTMIYVLIAALAASGKLKLTAEGDEDKDVSNYEKYVVGVPPYSVEVFGQNITYDWMQPLGTMLAIAAATSEEVDGEEDAPWNKQLWSKLKVGADVFTEQTFLRGIFDFMSGVGSGGFAEGLANLATSEVSSLVPTIFSQLASFLDPYRRQTYVKDDLLQTAFNKVKFRIPLLRNTLPEQVNLLGENAQNVQYKNFWSSFLAPGNRYPKSSGDVAEGIYELYNKTGDGGVMPPYAHNYFSVKGKSINLTTSEKNDMQRAIGHTATDILEVMFESEKYKKLNDEQKAKAVKSAYSYSLAKAKSMIEYDYDVVSEMHGGKDVLTKERWNRLDDAAKQRLVDEYFLSKQERSCREDEEKLANLFISKAQN